MSRGFLRDTGQSSSDSSGGELSPVNVQNFNASISSHTDSFSDVDLTSLSESSRNDSIDLTPQKFIDHLTTLFSLTPNQAATLQTVAWLEKFGHANIFLHLFQSAQSFSLTNLLKESRIQNNTLDTIASRITENFQFNETQKTTLTKVIREAIFDPRKKDYRNVYLRVKVTLENDYEHLGFKALGENAAFLKAYNKDLKGRCRGVLNQFRIEVIGSVTGVKYDKCTLEVFLLKMYTKYKSKSPKEINNDYKERIAILRRYVREHKASALASGDEDEDVEVENDENAEPDDDGAPPPTKKRKSANENPNPNPIIIGTRKSFWRSVDEFLKVLVKRNGVNTGTAEWQRYLRETYAQEKASTQTAPDISLGVLMGQHLPSRIDTATPASSSGTSDYAMSEYSPGLDSDAMTFSTRSNRPPLRPLPRRPGTASPINSTARDSPLIDNLDDDTSEFSRDTSPPYNSTPSETSQMVLPRSAPPKTYLPMPANGAPAPRTPLLMNGRLPSISDGRYIMNYDNNASSTGFPRQNLLPPLSSFNRPSHAQHLPREPDHFRDSGALLAHQSGWYGYGPSSLDNTQGVFRHTNSNVNGGEIGRPCNGRSVIGLSPLSQVVTFNDNMTAPRNSFNPPSTGTNVNGDGSASHGGPAIGQNGGLGDGRSGSGSETGFEAYGGDWPAP